MKSGTIVTLVAGLATGLVAMSGVAQAANTFNVNVRNDEQGQLTISYRTAEMMSAMCYLRANRLNVKTPGKFDKLIGEIDGQPVAAGEIELVVGTDIHARCMMATGPHSGSTTLAIGSALPALPAGRYELRINNEVYGKIVVAQEKAHFVSMADDLN